MKQRLGHKKHKKCEEIASKIFSVCFVRGGRDHFVAECYTEDKSGIYWINYKNRKIEMITDYHGRKIGAA